MAEPFQDEVSVGSVLRETYEITDVLGRGGMGTVYLATHRRLPGKRVAVKVLQGAVATEDMYARFKREAEIVSRLGHPNVVEVLDYNTLEHGTPYLVLEYLRGESLHARLKRGPVPQDEAFGIIRQVGSALHSAHKAGVVHRDLKPDNIFLVPSDSGGTVHERVKLLDFGISKLADSDSSLKTRDAVLIGTPQYMAPEQALGKNSEIDARTDVFALGCIVYEMLSGKGPFAGALIAEVVYRVVHERPTPLVDLCPQLSLAVVQAVDKAMSKAQADRFNTVAEFVTELTGVPLKTLSHPSLPAVGGPATPVSSGISLDVTMRPSKLPTSNQRPKASEGAPRLFGTPPLALRGGGPSKTLALALAIGVGGAAGIGGALYYRARQRPPVETPRVTAPLPAPPPVVEAPPPPPPPEEEIRAPRPSPRNTEPTPTPEVLADLDAANAALAQGDATEAIRLARHSQRLQVHAASYSVLTRAHCLQGDLSNAHAQFAKVPAGDRHSVQAYCRSHGIDL